MTLASLFRFLLQDIPDFRYLFESPSVYTVPCCIVILI